MKKEIYFSNFSKFYNDKIGIEIRNNKDLSPNDILLAEKAEFNSEIPLDAISVLGTNQQQAYSTHGIYRYFGKFPPSIATYLITQYTNSNDIVMDPMSGSGSTALECLILGRNCVANDVNPLSVQIIKAKVTHLDYQKLMQTLLQIEKDYRPLSIDEYNFYPANCNCEHWFLPETCDSLRGIKKLISEIKDEKIRNFYEIIFASIIRKVSKATTQQGRLFLDAETAIKNAFPIFKKKALKEISNVSELPMIENEAIKVFNQDLKDDVFQSYKGKIQLIILHPPYFNSYKYSSINSLESSWLEINRTEVRKHEIREFFKVGKPERYIDYVNDMEIALNKALTFLKKDGVLALMIGDTIIKGEYIPVTQCLIDKVDKTQYAIEKISIRVPKYTEASWVASQRRQKNNIGITINDFIIIFRKK